MARDHRIGYRNKSLIGAGAAFHLRLAADPARPFVGAGGHVAGALCPCVLPADREDIRPTSEQAPEQGDFRGGWRGSGQAMGADRNVCRRRQGVHRDGTRALQDGQPGRKLRLFRLQFAQPAPDQGNFRLVIRVIHQPVTPVHNHCLLMRASRCCACAGFYVRRPPPVSRGVFGTGVRRDGARHAARRRPPTLGHVRVRPPLRQPEQTRSQSGRNVPPGPATLPPSAPAPGRPRRSTQ